MVAESVAANILKIDSVVFELWPFYLITLWSAFVSLTKNNKPLKAVWPDCKAATYTEKTKAEKNVCDLEPWNVHC